jgi:hypothetical protein
MVGANEAQKSGTETEFSLAALELDALRPKTHAAPEDGQPAQPAAPTVELTLNGTQVLLALGAVWYSPPYCLGWFCTIGSLPTENK